MQISPSTSTPTIAPGANAGNASAVDGTSLGLGGENAATATPVTPTPTTAAPLRRGLNNWDTPLQDDISGAQQALDFLEQSAAQLRSLKTDLSTKLANRQRSDGTLDARVRQFSNTWRNRTDASGGTLDSQLNFSTKGSKTTFTIRGMTLANLRSGGREVLAISIGGGQNVRSVVLEPGLSDEQIAQRVDDALAPAGVRADIDDDGNLEFTTAESQWGTVRDTISVQGSGTRFPTGQMNRVKADAKTSSVDPDSWQTGDTDALRGTLQQVVQALAQVEQAMATVQAALNDASARAQTAQASSSATGTDTTTTAASMDQAAANFATIAKQPGYQSLLSLTSALSGISRERVVSLLSLR
jgi:hypothetical protein